MLVLIYKNNLDHLLKYREMGLFIASQVKLHSEVRSGYYPVHGVGHDRPTFKKGHGVMSYVLCSG